MPKPPLLTLACEGKAVRNNFITLCILKALSPYAKRVLLDTEKEQACPLSCTGFTAENPTVSSLPSV